MLVVVGIVVALAALLAVPVDVAFRLERVEALAGELTFRWLFGLVCVRTPVPRSRGPGAEPDAEPEGVPARGGRRRRRGGPREVLAVLRQPGFRRRVHRLAADLVRAAHVRRFHLALRLGLGDPADTGRLWALVGPLAALARNVRGAEVWIEPEFVDEVLELDARGRLRLVPLQLLALVVSFALSPSSIRAWRTLRSGHA